MRFIAGLILLAMSTLALADIANGSFTAPTEREDNTPLAASEIGGYNVYQDGILVQTLPATATTFSVTLGPGTYNFNLTTVDTDGRESVFSATVGVVIFSAPKPPANIQFTIGV